MKIRHFIAVVIAVSLAFTTQIKAVDHDVKVTQPSQPSVAAVYSEPVADEQIPATKPITNERTFVVTAYTANDNGQDGRGITASGTTVNDHTASCPKEYEFGTKLYIPALDKTYVCEDRGGAIKGNHLDIYVKRYKDAMDFGRQTLIVIVNGA